MTTEQQPGPAVPMPPDEVALWLRRSSAREVARALVAVLGIDQVRAVWMEMRPIFVRLSPPKRIRLATIADVLREAKRLYKAAAGEISWLEARQGGGLLKNIRDMDQAWPAGASDGRICRADAARSGRPDEGPGRAAGRAVRHGRGTASGGGTSCRRGLASTTRVAGSGAVAHAGAGRRRDRDP